MAKKKTSFEDDLIRLEAVIDTVDSGDTTLDAAIKLYKEGLGLIEKCTAQLQDFENQVLALEKDSEGKLVPFSDTSESQV